MGLIVSAVGLNQSDACPAVLQRKDRRRRDARTGSAAAAGDPDSAEKNLTECVKNVYKKMPFMYLVMKTIFECVYMEKVFKKGT